MSDAEGEEEDADNNENSKKDDDEEQDEEEGDEGGDKTENAEDDQITEDDLNKEISAPRKGETPMAENQQNHERAAETCEATDMEQDNGDNTGGEEASGDQTGASENKSDGTKGNQQTQVERPKPRHGDEKSSDSAELEKHETKEKESEVDAEQETGTEFERDSTAQKEVIDEAEEGTREKIERMELEDSDKDVQKEEPMDVDHDENSKLESKTGDKIDDEKIKHSEENNPEEPIKEDIEMKKQLEKNNVIMTNHCNLPFDKMGNLEEMDRHALEVISMKPAGQEAQLAWRELNMLQSSQAQRLAEQLRLILEPKKASALKGDYRTGKRLNMRKVIPYIASQFQKDRIWLRRTKPRNRNHQIVLALDDSESMIDNKSKKLAFESLALVSSALKLIEIKNLGVFRFGAETESILQLGDELNDVVGGNIISRCTFEQQATDMVKMLDFARRSFSEADSEGVASKLLIVITDAQGIFKEGRAAVADQVKQARQRGMMVMLVVVDNAEKSITEIKSAKFVDGKVTWKSYLDDFPFPYYIILRNLERLPEVLAGALRQWFEILESES